MKRTLGQFLVCTLIVIGSIRISDAQVALTEPTPFPIDTGVAGEDEYNRRPKLLERVGPPYPAAAKDGQEDEVFVAFVVGKGGEVTDVRAFFSRYPEFEASAVSAVQKWKFTPGRHEGYYVKTRMIVCVKISPPNGKK